MMGYGPLGDLLFFMAGAIVGGRLTAFVIDTYREMRASANREKV